MEQYDEITATFQPKRTDDLKPGRAEWIGWTGKWIASYRLESGRYKGQWSFMATDDKLPRPFFNVPECDLKIVGCCADMDWTGEDMSASHHPQCPSLRLTSESMSDTAQIYSVDDKGNLIPQGPPIRCKIEVSGLVISEDELRRRIEQAIERVRNARIAAQNFAQQFIDHYSEEHNRIILLGPPIEPSGVDDWKIISVSPSGSFNLTANGWSKTFPWDATREEIWESMPEEIQKAFPEFQP
jgi:hypothetical protein